MRRLLATLMLALLWGGCGASAVKPEPARDSVAHTAQPSTSLDEDIGQMLLVGFRGTTADTGSHIARDLRQYHVGAVILFDYDGPSGRRGRNIQSASQVQRLCAQLHDISPSLLIGIDQEGGLVSRLHSRYGFPRFLSAQASERMGTDSVRATASATARTLATLGINLNFAPVADVDINPQCPVIGKLERSFSASPQRVTECCRTWIEEQRDYQVASCLKHFPGHGSATGDTHKGLVDVTATWQASELEPYRALAADSALMVMTAHVVNRRLDPSGLPASLSPLITSLLRDSLGFQGVICTDDLAMGAIAQHYTLQQTVRLAIEAGADMLCLSNNGAGYDPDLVPRVVEIIRQMVSDGSVDPARIHRSAERVRHLQKTVAQ